MFILKTSKWKVGTMKTQGVFPLGLGIGISERRRESRLSLWIFGKFGRGKGCLNNHTGKESRDQHCAGEGWNGSPLSFTLPDPIQLNLNFR